MGSCLSFLFNQNCPHYDECCYDECNTNNNCHNAKYNSHKYQGYPQYQTPTYHNSQYQQPIVRRYDIDNPGNYVCISCGAYHSSPYSITCRNCSKIEHPKPSAPPM